MQKLFNLAWHLPVGVRYLPVGVITEYANLKPVILASYQSLVQSWILPLNPIIKASTTHSHMFNWNGLIYIGRSQCFLLDSCSLNSFNILCSLHDTNNLFSP